jgi:hypothetical protein
MKHILNNLSQEEKNSILEQHRGGMKVMTENFNKLLNSKLGDVKPLVNEQVLAGLSTGNSSQAVKSIFSKCPQVPKELGPVATTAANSIYNAVQGLGTNEQAIVQAISSLKTLNQFCSAATAYQKTYGVDMYQALDDDIDQESVWSQISRILVNLRPDPAVAQRTAAKKGVSPTPKTVGNPAKPGARPTTGGAQRTVGNPNTKPPQKPVPRQKPAPTPNMNLIGM